MADGEKEKRVREIIAYLKEGYNGYNEVPETNQDSTAQGLNRISAGSRSVQHGPGDGGTCSYGSPQPAITGSSLFTIPSSCSGGFYSIASTSSAVLEDTMRPHDTGIPAGSWSVQHGPGDRPTPSYGSEQPAITGSSRFTIPSSCTGGFYSIASTSSALFEDTMRPHDTGHPEGMAEDSNQKHGSRTDKEPRNACTFCEEPFRCAEGLEKHKRESVSNGKHQCRKCSKWFPSHFEFQRHYRTHTGKRPYTCKECQHKFTRKYHFTQHHMTHTGEQPFRCDHCRAKFKRKTELTKHINKQH